MIFLSETIATHSPSCEVIGRGASTILHGLPDHPRPRIPVSRGLPKLTNEDFQWMSILTSGSFDGLGMRRSLRGMRNVVEQVGPRY